MLPHHAGPGIVMYTTFGCSECKKAGAYMERNGIDFRAINLSRHPDISASLVRETGIRKVPQIFVDGEFIGGAPQLMELHRRGIV